MRELSPAIKKKLRALTALAYERELSAALSSLESEFAKWRARGLDAFELNDRVHRYHDGAARDLWKLYATHSTSTIVVRSALDRGVLKPDEVGDDVIANLPPSFE